ncbi:MAG: hypothetical protein O7A08_13330 [SAR324 cluster bacterium]|nr:hypothetical protein [SAR324 cluster bacterium]MCZ6533929.1 hypothetical protein [SAR324 cluster bacterium]MCZ6558400.1 hypothetical protein [SAR324 cluster bacterium]MCZ6628146.1 hypothetical protein [SAR324 cluster bacterium]MCZ6645653.1 hypothetical protein [SAR324 cluster bacterium]
MLLFAISGLVLLVAVLVISYPLIFHALEDFRVPPSPEDDYSERDALLEAMNELEISHGTGKLSEDDYQTEKLQLQRRYLQVAGQAPAGGKGSDGD